LQHIKVIAVGKLKERFWVQACDEYIKRLRPYVALDVVELPDIDPARAGGEAPALAREAEAIFRAVPEGACMVLLDVAGKDYSSEQIARMLDDLATEGKNDVAFVIGSSCGVDKSVRDRADVRLSFGKITMPHNIARVVLLEQLYRAQKIIRREPYHK
jgi:23S rRNA (pseudouridine1915-N3)-methyltransferase